MKIIISCLVVLFLYSCKNVNTHTIEGSWSYTGRPGTKLVLKITSDSVYQYCNNEFIRAFKYTQKNDSLFFEKYEPLSEKIEVHPLKFRATDSSLIINRITFYKFDSLYQINSDTRMYDDCPILFDVYQVYQDEENFLRALFDKYEIEYVDCYYPFSLKKKFYVSDTATAAKVLRKQIMFDEKIDQMAPVFGREYKRANNFFGVNIVKLDNSFNVRSSKLQLQKKRRSYFVSFFDFYDADIDSLFLTLSVDSIQDLPFRNCINASNYVFVNNNRAVTFYHSYDEEINKLKLVFPWKRKLENWDSLDSLNITVTK